MNNLLRKSKKSVFLDEVSNYLSFLQELNTQDTDCIHVSNFEKNLNK